MITAADARVGTGDAALAALAREAGRVLQAARWRLSTAESCTGGWIAKCLTDIAGSSSWFERGYVTYSDAAKVQTLGVSSRTLQAHGAVSAETATEMATGALMHSGADVAVSVTGIAGPDGGSAEKPVGLVWFGLACRGASTRSERHCFDGDRAAIRSAAVARALKLVIEAAHAAPAGSVAANPRS
jgi:nicotinamide-nucleotide amidase